jgi:hypothetical protein
MAFVQHPAFPNDAPQQVADPDAWAEQGWIVVSEQAAAELDPTITPRPAGNASREEWLAYAEAQPNADSEHLATLTRDDLRDLHQ